MGRGYPQYRHWSHLFSTYFAPKLGIKTFDEWKNMAEQHVREGKLSARHFQRIVDAQFRWNQQHSQSLCPYHAPSLDELNGHGKPVFERPMAFPSANGIQPIIPRNYREASKLGRYYAAVQGLDSDNPEVVKAAKAELRRLSRMNVYDANGQKHSLKDATNLEIIRTMQDGGYLPDGDYGIEVNSD